MVVPFVNKNIMEEHLAQISRATASGRHAVIIMDGAGWHSDDIDAGFNNISTIKLPPYSPELNPIEQVWSWMRQHHLANRSFKGYDNIVDEVCNAWNDFVSDSNRVINMCTRDWMNLIS
jgi:transposase